LKLSDLVNQLVIDPRKLTEYALDPTSTRGRDKAIVFEQVLGYTKENYAELLRQLEEKCPDAEASVHRAIDQGILYRVDVLIHGKTDKQAMVRTGWIIRPGTNVARLTTVYVLRK